MGSLMRGGQLRENTLGVLIAVIGLVLIFGIVGYSLYHYFTLSAQQNEEQAKGTLKVVDAKIQALKEGQETRFLVKGPCEAKQPQDSCNWFLTGWGVNDDNRPERCFFKSCICVCNVKSDAVSLNDRSLLLRDTCQDRQTGFCAPVVNVARVKVSSAHQRAPFIVIGHAAPPTDALDTINKSFIPFASNLIELKMWRSAEELEIILI